MPEKRKAEKLPSERGRIIHHLGKWCIAPCRGRSPLPLRSAQNQRPLDVGSAPCGQQMISVDFQSASIITVEAALPLRWLRQLLLCGLAARKSFRKRIPFSKSKLYNRASDKS